jgi:YesN/AraC family two-component response regulator
MKLNEKDIEMFKAFSRSETGKNLVDYLQRVITHTCDVRNMANGDTKESIQKAASTIEKHIIDKITKRSDLKSGNVGQFE